MIMIMTIVDNGDSNDDDKSTYNKTIQVFHAMLGADYRHDMTLCYTA